MSIESKPDEATNCVLCRRLTVEDKWPLVFRSEFSATLVPSKHTAPGTVLVVPIRHVLSPLELTADEAADLFSLLRRTVTAIFNARRCDYYHISQYFGPTSGEPMDHIHWRVEPRTAGISHPFRPFDDLPLVPTEERVALAESLRAAEAVDARGPVEAAAPN